MHRYLISLLCAAICIIGAVQADIVQFSPGIEQVPSVRVDDMACGTRGECYFATDNGLSVFNGSWTTLHPNFSSRREGILSDRVLALERDAVGTLWIGYPTGLQWYNESGFFTLQDQQLLKNLAINDLQRRGDEMWVASGDAGLHRFRNGTWTWFKPHGESGLTCNHIYSMALDRETGALFLGAGDAGIYVLENETDPVRFQKLQDLQKVPLGIEEVRSDPTGGILFFNSTDVFHIREGVPYKTEIHVESLVPPTQEILDVARTPSGELLLATDTGIFLYQDSQARLHIGKSDGLWGSRVRRLLLDEEGRCWFSASGSVGYLYNWSRRDPFISVQPAPTDALEPLKSPVTLAAPLPPSPRETTEEPNPNPAWIAEYCSNLLTWIDDRVCSLRTWIEDLRGVALLCGDPAPGS